MLERPIYTLDLSVAGCFLRASLNGMVFLTLGGHTPGRISVPINHLLVGTDNVLAIELAPTVLLAENRLSTPLDIKVAGDILAHPGPGHQGDPPSELERHIDATSLLAQCQKKPTFPARFEVRFDSTGSSFEHLLKNAPPLSKDRVLRYAHGLLGLVASGDLEAVGKEFEPKLRDYDRAYYVFPSSEPASFIEFLETSFIPAGPLLDIEPEEFMAIPYCGESVWQVVVQPNDPLLKTAKNEEGGYFMIDVFVAEVNGELKVVR